MSFFCRLSRKHYWCTPHRSEDHRLIQVCYECGAERPVRELHSESVEEPLTEVPRSKPLASGNNFLRKLAAIK
ncbi:MAG: hypothetical protein HY231_01595 [Acidobacteria bacterium]|nr:hypothetical protein [Acidobacteriota bacterium]